MQYVSRHGACKNQKMIELSVSQTEKLIDEWVFSERDRALMKRRLLDAITYERLSEEFEMSVSQVKRIIKKHRETLIKHI